MKLIVSYWRDQWDLNLAGRWGQLIYPNQQSQFSGTGNTEISMVVQV